PGEWRPPPARPDRRLRRAWPSRPSSGTRSGRGEPGRRDRERRRELRLEAGARSRGELLERPEPAQPLLPGHAGVRGRRRGEHEERGAVEPPRLQPVLGAPSEDTVVRDLTDEPARRRSVPADD